MKKDNSKEKKYLNLCKILHIFEVLLNAIS